MTGLTDSKSYAFRVAARNRVGTGPQSALGGPGEADAGPALTVATVDNTVGNMNQSAIVDAYGHPLYLYTPDGSGTVSKAGANLGLWPAVAWSGTPTVGGGLDPSKAAVYVAARRHPPALVQRPLALHVRLRLLGRDRDRRRRDQLLSPRRGGRPN